MKHTKKEIMDALQIIKDECTGTRCMDCPFYKDGKDDCTIHSADPMNWSIKEVEPEQVWRAFK